MEFLIGIWIFIQLVIGYNLLLPAILFVLWPLLRQNKVVLNREVPQLDYAIIVTAYQFTDTLPGVVNSILKLNYSNYLIYIAADNCNTTGLDFGDERVVLLRPPEVLASNTKSHHYAIKNFQRMHDVVTIIDSDNLVESQYLAQMNLSFSEGFEAVQGLRDAKNLDGTIACLDAARDIYYHFYDGKLLFECGSSATLSGSGMAFKASLYTDFLTENSVTGAGFDKVLQAWLLKKDKRIAFNEKAIVYDEKTSRPEQLVNQRSRWINTWFKYFGYGFTILGLGIKNFSRNQLLFGLILLRPPLFMFLVLSVLFLFVNLLAGMYIATVIWLMALLIFVIFFGISLKVAHADARIYKSLVNIPKFIFYQIISLTKARKANKISVATRHYAAEEQKDA
jgi:cellulose synthase/poly-beta-1,6-N-acetylglucosamine synthase-like glycosyltransferase